MRMADQQSEVECGSPEEAKICPKYLSSNATSHVWPFGAFAEIIDNAYDPDVGAKHMAIEFREPLKCFAFLDDGKGMTRPQLHRMLSFGYSDKPHDGDYKPIGRYGNGFKSGSMRLGKDALVMTREVGGTRSVGFLSQTFNEDVAAESLQLPMVSWDADLNIIGNVASARKHIAAIAKYSPFKSEDALHEEMQSILHPIENARSGTKIFVFNLRRGMPAIDGEDEKQTGDEHFPEDAELRIDLGNQDIVNSRAQDNEPRHRSSLRKYLSILYLRRRMQIRLLGRNVTHLDIARNLKQRETDSYRPHGRRDPLVVRLGYHDRKNEAESEDYGLVIYHHNRLIEAFVKVGYQRTMKQAVGVVAVVEADFLTPLHTKQGFDQSYDARYKNLLLNVGTKLDQYYEAKMGKKPAEASQEVQVVTWVMCDSCGSFRRLLGVSQEEVESWDQWHCSENTDARYNRCNVAQEQMLDDEVVCGGASYAKTPRRQAAKRRRLENDDEEKRRNKHYMEQWAEIRKLSYKMATAFDSLDDAVPDAVRQVVEQAHADRQRSHFLKCALCRTTRVVAPADQRAADALVWRCSDGGMSCQNVVQVQCCRCDTWRLLPPGISEEEVASDWECSLNPDERFGSCEEPQEAGSDTDDAPAGDDKVFDVWCGCPPRRNVLVQLRAQMRTLTAAMSELSTLATTAADGDAQNREEREQALAAETQKVAELEEALTAAQEDLADERQALSEEWRRATDLDEQLAAERKRTAALEQELASDRAKTEDLKGAVAEYVEKYYERRVNDRSTEVVTQMMRLIIANTTKP